jgi:hypothetical protein
MHDFIPGARLDDRPEAEKLKDYHFGEIVAATNPVAWTEKPRASWRRFPIANQNGSGSCVAQTIRKQAGVMYFLRHGVFPNFSASDIYQRRSNRPAPGMNGVEAFELWRQGITLNEFAPSDGLTDSEMDSLGIPPQAREAGRIFRLGNYVILPTRDIDTIASVIQTTGKAVMVWTFWRSDEWLAVPRVLQPDLTLAAAPGRHSTAAVDFTMYEGEKALVADESWGVADTFDGQRVLKESFFQVRNWFAAYPINFAFDDQTKVQPQNRPRHTFNQPLAFIPWDDTKDRPADMPRHEAQLRDVIALQDVLKHEGAFPRNVASTGYYGAITAKSVLAFQRKHLVAPEAELAALAGRTVGPKTRAKLNELYGS